jgi:hypothetical protein
MDELTVEEVLEVNTQDTLTPSPILEPTEYQKAQIKVLLESGMSPSDIFTTAFLPLEWAVAIKAEQDALNQPIINQDEGIIA